MYASCLAVNWVTCVCAAIVIVEHIHEILPTFTCAPFQDTVSDLAVHKASKDELVGVFESSAAAALWGCVVGVA